MNATPASRTENPTTPAVRVILADDDVELCTMVSEYLCEEGYQVDSVHDGQAAIDCARAGGADVLVMDIMMPRVDGFEALRQIRTFSTVPVLILTARGDDVDRIVGLEIGADDYLPKPFNPRELSARLRAIMRRVHDRPAANGTRRVQIGDLELEPGARNVHCNGQALPLTATEYVVAEILMLSAGSVVSKERLSEEALGRRLTPFDRSIDTHVSNLRRKLGPAPDGSQRIKTIRGRGYLYVLH